MATVSLSSSVVSVIIFVVFLALAIWLFYQFIREDREQKEANRRFGALENDALHDQAASVRDGKVLGKANDETHEYEENNTPLTIFPTQPENSVSPENTLLFKETPTELIDSPDSPEIALPIEKTESSVSPLDRTNAEKIYDPIRKTYIDSDKANEIIQVTAPSNPFVTPSQTQPEWSPNPNRLKQYEFSCFDLRFDFMAYLDLTQWQELANIPQFSRTQICQIIGQNTDGDFQEAQALEGQLYRAFVIGLQGVSRRGLVNPAEIDYFVAQVNQFAQIMDAEVVYDDKDSYLTRAQEMDQWCLEVDQLFEIYLMAHERTLDKQRFTQKLHELGYTWQDNGQISQQNGQLLCQATPIFSTQEAEPNAPYEGIVMTFDAPHIAEGEQGFDDFMMLLVSLADAFDLELTNAQKQALSEEELLNMRQIVGCLQNKMKAHQLEAGGELAVRLFS